MTPLPDEGAVLVVTDRPVDWGAAVADRNSNGLRTALLVVAPDLDKVSDLAKHMADEVFRGAPWTLLDTRERA